MICVNPNISDEYSLIINIACCDNYLQCVHLQGLQSLLEESNLDPKEMKKAKEGQVCPIFSSTLSARGPTLKSIPALKELKKL